MCLTNVIDFPSLRIEGQLYLIGQKSFSHKHDDLYGAVMEYHRFEFEITKLGLLAPVDNQFQQLRFILTTDRAETKEKAFDFKFGYHVDLFKENDWSLLEEDLHDAFEVTLPVIFVPDWFQATDGSSATVESFVIPNRWILSKIEEVFPKVDFSEVMKDFPLPSLVREICLNSPIPGKVS